MKRKAANLFAICASLMVCAAAYGTPTQDDVFKSISQNVNQSTNSGPVLLVLLITTLVVVALIVLSQRQKRQIAPKVLNHPKKLAKEVAKQVDINPREVKRLKMIAEEKGYSSPLVLMLCPSLMKEPKKTKSQG